MLKRIVVLSLVCMFSAQAMDREKLIQKLWDKDVLPHTFSIEEVSTHAIKKEDEPLFTACAKHLSPEALERMNAYCVQRIPLKILRTGSAAKLTRILGTITHHRQLNANKKPQ